MKSENVKKIVSYWEKTAEHDYDTMIYLFKGKRYSESLFFGHIILEKILKGLVVRETKEQAPYIHDLVRLQEVAKLELSKEKILLLKEVNDFNIRGRYPDYKLRFHKLCNKEFSKDYLDKIIKLYRELCQRLEQKK